jgi:hypothetical protein
MGSAEARQRRRRQGQRGTDQRLLAKAAPPRATVRQDLGPTSTALSDADVEAILATIGWA